MARGVVAIDGRVAEKAQIFGHHGRAPVGQDSAVRFDASA